MAKPRLFHCNRLDPKEPGEGADEEEGVEAEKGEGGKRGRGKEGKGKERANDDPSSPPQSR